MSQYHIRERDKIDRARLFVDVRTKFEILFDFISIGYASIAIIAFLAVLILLYSPLLYVLTPVMVIIALVSSFGKPKHLPMKLPVTDFKGVIDINENQIGKRSKNLPAAGNILVGNCQVTGQQIWATPGDYLTHLMFIATTGGGKTEGLLSFSAATAFATGGALLYGDFKAGPDFIFQITALARMTGRESQVRYVNFRTGGEEITGRHWRKDSNTNAPFSVGSSGSCLQVIEGIMPESDPSNAYFKDRAVASLKTLFPALCELRDLKLLNISPGVIAYFADIPKFIEMAYPEYNNYEITYEKPGEMEVTVIPNVLKENTKHSIRTFLKNLPEFSDNPEDLSLEGAKNQPSEVDRQFGFGKGYFLKAMIDLSTRYGHIYEAEMGEVDFADCVRNNRILLMMVPAMEESKSERNTLGKLQLQSLRVAASKGLGKQSEGDYDDVIANLPVDKKIPSLMVIDEWSEAMVPGFAVLATQARSLGIICCFAGQDLAGPMSASKEETQMIFGSTRIKFLGALQDINDTWEWFKKLADTEVVVKSGGFQKESDFIDPYERAVNSTIDQVERLNIKELLDLREGEVKMFWRDKLINTDLFYHAIDHELAKNWRFNRLLPIGAPSTEEMKDIDDTISREYELLNLIDEGGEFNRPENSMITQNQKPSGTKWIYKLLKEDASVETINSSLLKQQAAEKESEPVLAPTESENTPSTPPTYEAQEEASEPPPQTNKSERESEVIETGSLFENSIVGLKSEPKDEQSIYNEKVNQVVNDAENHWLFNYETTKGKRAGAKELHAQVASLLELVGVDKDDASLKAAESIESITSSTKYTSIDIEPKEDDPELLWKAMKELEDS